MIPASLPIIVQERQSTTIGSELAGSISTAFWKAADCKVQRAPGDDAWTLTAGDSTGVIRSISQNHDVTLNVTAKLRGADVFFLADYAFGQRHEPLRIFDFDSPLVDAVRDDPTACLLMWHARSISQFASRWLRRDYRRRDQTFTGKIKGKVLVGQYVKGHLAVGEPNTVPCRTIERTQDTANNRILKAGLRYIAALSHILPVPAASRAVMKQVAATLPKFAQVSDINLTPADIRNVSTRGPQRHYGPILRATQELLAHKFLTDHHGDTETQSFMWHMPTLFQESVRGLISSFPDIALDTTAPPRATIYDNNGVKLRSSPVDPDLVIKSMTNGAHVLLDTKYKQALSQGSSQSSEDGESLELPNKLKIKVSRADVYQAVAYRKHDRWKGALSGLLYPVCLEPGHSLPRPLQIHGFGEAIYLVFIDIGPRAGDNIGAFHDVLRELVAVPHEANLDALHT
ncbi:5-methylcytosine restriction system specificity protein McrC [Rhodococcoides fascians]|uniref:5-methylcytosine restriction system specificity protein McrC n=1 Tax=Rhodococcoides fascians TaxID=1828 RepID=UPI00050CF1B1|nr:hypothetical protein [Rhodococcus fascians]